VLFLLGAAIVVTRSGSQETMLGHCLGGVIVCLPMWKEKQTSDELSMRQSPLRWRKNVLTSILDEYHTPVQKKYLNK
jgi:hypothetical protein